MKRLISLLVLFSSAAWAEPVNWYVKADGSKQEVTVYETAGEGVVKGMRILTVDPPVMREATEKRTTPGDYQAVYAEWDVWPGGAKVTPQSVNICPLRDEVGTNVLGGLFRAIDVSTLKVSKDGKDLKRDEDFKLDPDWGRLAGLGGKLGPAGTGELVITYSYATQRLDLVQIKDGVATLKKGEPKMVCPALPTPDDGATAIAGVYVAPWMRDGKYVIAQDDIYPIGKPTAVPPVNPEKLAGARKILANGGELKFAFIGDSVTLGAEAGQWWNDLWTEKSTAYVWRVVVALRKQYPKATITPIHAVKGGTSAKAAIGLFDASVADQKPNIVLIAFGLNDAHSGIDKPATNPPAEFKEDIRAIIAKAKAVGAEVILVTPFQPNPFMKNKIGERILEYRRAMLELAKEENVGLADVYAAWMQQAEKGVPPFSQLHNWINHPDPRGHIIYAEQVLQLFTEAKTTQPAEIPGAWEYKSAPLPDLATVIKNAKPNGKIYGLYTWKNEYAANRKSIQEIGWQSFRAGGTMDDAFMTQLAEDGKEVMLTVGPGRIPKEFENEAKLVEAYPGKLETIINRYGPGGSFFAANPNVPKNPATHFEISNEPNFQYIIPPDGRPQKELEAARESLYAKLLPAAYTVKANHPDVSIVGFAAGGAGAGDIRFIQNVYKLDPNMGKAFDIFSTHPYVAPAPPEALSKRSWGSYGIAGGLDTLRKTIGDVPVWYTEIGWPIGKADGGYFEMKEKTVTPLLQAAYVVRLYAYAQRLGVQRVHVMFATDTDNYNAGFFLRDGTWRPSAKAVATMIKLMPNPQLTEALSDGEDGQFIYRFGDVTMAWRVQGTKTAEIPIQGKTTLTTMLGDQQTVEPTDGKVSIEIGPLPVYITAKN